MGKPQYGWTHQQRRQTWQAELQRLGTIPCRCGCGQLIRAGDPFDLGHGTPVAYGGDGTDSAPEIPGHNRAAGARIANTRRAIPASEDWW